jgi:hypothetical protein
MKKIESTDLEDISASFTDATAAVDAAIALMEAALSAARYSVKPGSQLYMEMRCYLPYVIHQTNKDGTQILANRHYKPVGSNVPTGGRWTVYEDQTNLHVSLTKEEISIIVSPGHTMGIFGDGNPPWRNRQAAKEYLQRLQQLASILKRK